MDTAHETVIRKAMGIMRSSLSEPLSIPELAKQVGYSRSHLRLIFSQATGKGILHHFLEMRIDKARRLLLDTNLTIDEIAYEVGFRSYRSFRAAFVKKVGICPGKFRQTQGVLAELSVGKNDLRKSATEMYWNKPLTGPPMDPSAVPSSGIWEQHDGYLMGRESGGGHLHFNEPLPENFELSFEARLFRRKGLSSSEFTIALLDNKFQADYYAFVLGRQDGTLSEFRTQSVPRLLNFKEVPKQEVWHKIKIELEDDTIALWLDEKEAFRHRDPFPPPFSKRSHFGFTITDSETGFRNLVVLDKGFLPLVKSVRQGDSLYNAGFFSSAREFYTRLLTSGISTADVMELRYKIGQCFLREGHNFQARSWLEKVLAVPGTGFWADLGALSVLEMDLQEDRFRNLEAYSSTEMLRNGAREKMHGAFDSFVQHGFYEKARSYMEHLVRFEHEADIPTFDSCARIAETFFLLRHYDAAEQAYQTAMGEGMPGTVRLYTLFSLANCYGAHGEIQLWGKTLDEIEGLCKHNVDLCRLRLIRSLVLRAKGLFAESLALLSRIHKDFPEALHWRVVAEIFSAFLQLAEGHISWARNFLDSAKKLDPNSYWLSPGRIAWSQYPIELAEGNVLKAAELLSNDARATLGSIQGAECAIKAGVMFYLADKRDAANEIWQRTGDYYIPTRFHYVGTFAQWLAKGEMPDPELLPYTGDQYSELLYLFGLLCEKQGKQEQALALFKKCIAEDPTLRWPAVFAKRRVASCVL